MEPKYFFIPTKYDIFNVASIFKLEKEELTDLDSSIEPKYDKAAPNDWIEIPVEESNWLIKRNITERAELQKAAVFKKIIELKDGDKCFHRTVNGDVLCTVVRSIKKPGIINFIIKLEDGTEEEVVSDDIEVYTDVNKHSQRIEDIMKLLLENKCDIQKNDKKNRCALSMAYELPNKRYFKMLLDTNKTELNINNDNIQSLLRNIVKDKYWGILELVLTKCKIEPGSNTFLINLALEALRAGNNDLLGVIFKFASGIDKLENKETFLTNLFKENIDGETIKRVIEMKLFNVNLANEQKETALILACERIMVAVVDTLLKHGADAEYDGHKAIEKAIDARRNFPAKQEDASKVVAMLHQFKSGDVAKNSVINVKDLAVKIDSDAPLDALGQQIFDIMLLLFINKGDMVLLNDKNTSVLTLSYILPNKRLFNLFLHNYQGKLDLLANVVGQGLLTKMVADKEMNTLKAVLDKSVFADNYEVFLLNLALTTLKNGMKNHYKMIVLNCVDKDKNMGNGEIFLTSCFKNNVIEKLISDVIRSGHFGINKANAGQETPLILACDRLMTNIVKLLLEKGADKSFRDYYAVDIVVAKGNIADDAVNRKAAKNLILDWMCGKDIEVKEKLQIMKNGFVAVTKKSSVEQINLDFRLGDPVITNARNKKQVLRPLNGELKWFGVIDDEICVGIELNNPEPYGTDGIINAEFRFDCAAGHGVITKIENVKLDVEALKLHCLPSNVIDSTKYLKVEKNLEDNTLKEMNLKINDKVYANILNNELIQKMIGTLRWFGRMNGVQVGIVELDANYKSGTNGLFWKHQLIQCQEKRAIAVTKDHIFKYIPFETIEIPKEDRIFPQININSRVIYYAPENGGLVSHYGIVRWSGIDMNKKYVYGIELNENYPLGTDGEFDDFRLFNCQPGHGVVSQLNHVAPDEDDTKPTNEEENIAQSKDSETVQYCTPMSVYTGKPCGIQGHKGSSFLDSFIFALFSNSDSLDFIITHFLNVTENDELIKNLRNIMSWKIVYPLRENGYVSYHKIKELKNTIKMIDEEHGGKTNFEDLESFTAVLVKMCPDEQLLSLITMPNTISKAMFLKLSQKPDGYSTCQQLLDMYMVQKNILFEQIPTCLIISIPMEQTNRKDYKGILPTKTIEIGSLCLNYFKKCSLLKCDSVAKFRCKLCVDNGKSIKKGLFCDKHKCHHKKAVNTDTCKLGSHSEVSMYLKAIICQRDGKYVAYVKENEPNDEWIYFNDDIENSPASPSISKVRELPSFLNKDINGMKDEVASGESIHLNPITRDSCIFVYLNHAKSCY